MRPRQELDLVMQARNFGMPAPEVAIALIKVLRPPSPRLVICDCFVASPRDASHMSLCSTQSALAHYLLQYNVVSQRLQYRSLSLVAGRALQFAHRRVTPVCGCSAAAAAEA